MKKFVLALSFNQFLQIYLKSKEKLVKFDQKLEIINPKMIDSW